MVLLAQAADELGVLQKLIQDGGPFVGAFALFVLGGVVLTKYGLMPVMSSILTIHTSAKETAIIHADASRANQAAAEKNVMAATMSQATTVAAGEITEKLLNQLAESRKS